MARQLSLTFRSVCRGLVLGLIGFTAVLSVSVRAQTPMMSTPPAPTAKTAPAKTNTTPTPPLPPPDTLGRYGNILAPGDQAAYPLKLKMPFPGVGELKIPSPAEVTMREKLEQLALLSDAELRNQLSQWPAFSRMNLRDEGTMLQRIQDFRDYRMKVAQQKAHDMGLLTLTDPQKVQFEKEYWSKRLAMERDLAKQVAPIVGPREQKFKDELYREFSSVSPGPLAQTPKAAAAPPKPAATPTAPANKPAPALVSSKPATNVMQPMEPMAAQAPR
jgi:hypothetical protein